ncbi:hypothetical protein, partial [Deinococcus indicus]|uniref:hypothetical protein n=1 Tax=Deinococcus indicus TaxID=223556 RepID=UPI001E4994F2
TFCPPVWITLNLPSTKLYPVHSLQAGYENWQTYGAALRKAAGLPPKRHLTRAAQQRRQERA